MPITTLDPNTALIVVDLQKGIVGSPLTLTHPVGEVVERAGSLAAAFRQHGLPVVLVNVAGGAPGRTERPPRIDMFAEGWTDLIPELDQRPSDIVVTKRTWGAFANTDLEARLKALGITQVVVTGVATGTGVEATARQAYEQGFNVTLAIDAMTDMRPDAYDYSIANVFPRLGRHDAGHSRSARATERLTMQWLQLLSYVFGGAFFTNAVPHFVSGVTGKPFQSPFAKPPGQGLSSSTVNVLWGFFNIAIFYLLVCRVGDFDVKNAADAVAFGLGMLALGLPSARHFGRFNGGNAPERS